MKEKRLLIVFVKNPQKGHVKTRLAETVGDEKAWKIYLALLNHTIWTAASVHSAKQIWYSDFIDWADGLEEQQSDRLERPYGSGPAFEKKLQYGENLGERMSNAFREGFDSRFEKVVIIGSDCPDISPEIIEEGFARLDNADVVIGPSEDGGYYLIGSGRFIPKIFRNISWSTRHVLNETLHILKKNNCSFELLPVLNDIDTEEDLQNSNLNE